jgi:hypothetical protein
MNHNTATAYGCVAYRIMKDEGKEESEEYLELLMETLYDFYNGKDILAIYRSKIKLDFYDVIVNDEKTKKLTNE